MGAPINPECRDEKCRNCPGDALDESTDEIVQCEHGCHTFQRINDDIAERPAIESWWV
jgi:hypothetical protein